MKITKSNYYEFAEMILCRFQRIALCEYPDAKLYPDREVDKDSYQFINMLSLEDTIEFIDSIEKGYSLSFSVDHDEKMIYPVCR